MTETILVELNEGADFWYDEIGVNPIPAITTNKQKVDENGNPLPIHPFGILKYYWRDKHYNLRDEDMPRELFEYFKSNNCYEKGIAIAGGLIHRGKHQGRYLTLVDLDNQKGIDVVFPKGLESLKAHTLVEQHKDRLDKVHAYFITSRPLATIPDTARPDGIKFEVKTKSTQGLHFVSPSMHKDGQRYEIVSETKTPVWLKDEEIKEFENHLLKLSGSNSDTKLKIKNNSIKAINEEAKKYDKENTDRQGWIYSKLGTHFAKIHVDEIDEIDCINKAIALNAKLTLPYPESRAIDIGKEFYNRYRVNDDDSKINPTQQKKIDENYKIIKDPLSTKTEIKKAKRAINEIYESAEITPPDWSEGDTSYNQLMDILKNQIKRTVISENNKNQVIAVVEISPDIIHGESHIEFLDFESIRFKYFLNFIIFTCFESERMSKEDYDSIISDLISNAQIGGAPFERTYNRIQSDEKKIVIDLGNQDFECIEITKDKIETKTLDEDSPILLRYQTTHQQVKPEFDHTNAIKEFAELLNFKDIQLFSVHLVTMFLADVTTPIMALTGKAGSQKTTTSAAIKRIIDPAGDSLEANVLSIPTKRDDIIMTLYNRYLTVFENVSKIDTDTSDILCRGVTGSSNTKRAHYKNLEEVIMTFKRKIILNGVTPNFNNGDLQTRLIKYSKKEDFTFLTDSEFEEKFVELRPKVLGQIFQVLQRVLCRINGFKTVSKTRMAEFERWGELISQELGYDVDTFGKIYDQKMKVTSIENKDAYPIIGIIESLMLEKEEYEDTVSNLFTYIKNQAISKGIEIKDKFISFPKAPNQLIDRMTDVGTIFDNLGLRFTTWNNTDDKEFGKNVKLIKITNVNLKPQQKELESYQK